MSQLERSLLQHSIKTSEWLQVQVSPLALMPNTLGATLHQFAERLRIPTEVCYLVVICAAASLLPSQTRLVLDPRLGIEAPPILWGGLVGDAGSGEYRIVNTLTRPLKGIQADHNIWYQPWIDEYKADARKSRRETDTGDPVDRPKPITLYTHDCTISAIGQILSQQPEWGLLLELEGMENFLQAVKARRRGLNLPQWLWLYDGCPLKIEHKATGPIFVPHPSVSIVGGIQMSILRAFGNKFVNLGISFWSRFAWVRVPFVPDPDTEIGLPLHSQQLLKIVYRHLQKFSPMQHNLDKEGQEIWNEWAYESIEPIFSPPDDVIRVMHAETKKRAARIALVLHWLDAACNEAAPSKVIPTDTLDRGIELALRLYQQSKTILSEVL